MIKKLLTTIVATLFLASATLAQSVVNIPDANFKNYLVNNTYINTNGNTEIELSEAQTYTGSIGCAAKAITSLIGIETFTALTQLSCSANQLTSLNLTNNTALVRLSCSDNQLTSLDLTNNTALVELYCTKNQLANLNVSQNTALTQLYCNINQLTSLNVSNNTALTELQVSYNHLTSLDVSHNHGLIYLGCANNQLTGLDVASNIALTACICYANQLTSLNIKNGNNINISTLWFDATYNPNLICIQVDSLEYAQANWSSKVDNPSAFSAMCDSVATNLKSTSTQNTDINIYPNPANETLYIESEMLNEKTEITIRDVLGCVVSQAAPIIFQQSAARITVQDLPSGIYFVNLKTNTGTLTLRFVKE